MGNRSMFVGLDVHKETIDVSIAEGAREFFHNRRLTRAANGQVANADNQTTKRAFAQNSFPVKVETQLDETVVNERQCIENCAQNGSANAVAAFEHNVDPELF